MDKEEENEFIKKGTSIIKKISKITELMLKTKAKEGLESLDKFDKKLDELLKKYEQ